MPTASFAPDRGAEVNASGERDSEYPWSSNPRRE
jgi:hypothetical protein